MGWISHMQNFKILQGIELYVDNLMEKSGKAENLLDVMTQ